MFRERKKAQSEHHSLIILISLKQMSGHAFQHSTHRHYELGATMQTFGSGTCTLLCTLH